MIKDIRILMFVPQYPFPVVGGLEKQAHELAKKLVGLGYSIEVLSGVVDHTNKKNEFIDGVLVYRLRWFKFKLFRFLLSPFMIIFFFAKNHKKYKLVHVHQHSWIGLFVILISKCFQLRVLTKLPSWGELGVLSIINSKFGQLKKRIFFLSDGVVVITQQSILELTSNGFPRNRIYFSPNGITIPRVNENPNVNNSKVVRVVYVGRLIELKQIDKLFIIWGKISKSISQKIELIICGNGPEAYNLLKLSESMNTNNIFFKGHVENVRLELLKSDIFVLPSRVEGNSNAILEAMMCGLPVVSTITGGTPFMVGDVGIPFLSGISDFNKMEVSLRLLIEDGILRKQIGNEMKSRVQNNFSIDIVAKNYLNIYSDLLNC